MTNPKAVLHRPTSQPRTELSVRLLDTAVLAAMIGFPVAATLLLMDLILL